MRRSRRSRRLHTSTLTTSRSRRWPRRFGSPVLPRHQLLASIDQHYPDGAAVETVDIPILDPFEVPNPDPFEVPIEEASTVEKDVEVVEDRRRGTRTWLAAAAALILLSGAGGWMWTRSRIDATTPPVAMPAAIHAPVASTASPEISPAPAAEPAMTPVEPAVSTQPVGDTIAQAVVQTAAGAAGTTGAATLPLPGPVVDPPVATAANTTPLPRLGEVPTLPANAPVERALADAPAAAPPTPAIPAVSAYRRTSGPPRPMRPTCPRSRVPRCGRRLAKTSRLHRSPRQPRRQRPRRRPRPSRRRPATSVRFAHH